MRTIAVDLTNAESITRIHEATDDLEVGLLVYNAGANTYGSEFVEGDLDRFQEIIDLNITAQLALVQHFGAAMKERRRGGLLLVGSLAGFLGSAQISIYAAVKAFCRTFAEGLWLEMSDHDVDVLEFVLGVARTPAMVTRLVLAQHAFVGQQLAQDGLLAQVTHRCTLGLRGRPVARSSR